MSVKIKQKNKIWFRAKSFGWGWYPCSWQGWLILTIYILIVVLDFFRLDLNSHSVSDTLRPWIVDIFILLFLLIGICFKKGEKPFWRWAGKKV